MQDSQGEKNWGNKKKALLLHRSMEENLSSKEICSEFSHFLLSHHVQINTGLENPCSDKSCARRSLPKAELPHPGTGISLLGLNKTFPVLCSAPAFLTQSIFSALAFNLIFIVTCSQRWPYPMGTLWEQKPPLPRQPQLPCQPLKN